MCVGGRESRNEERDLNGQKRNKVKERERWVACWLLTISKLATPTIKTQPKKKKNSRISCFLLTAFFCVLHSIAIFHYQLLRLVTSVSATDRINQTQSRTLPELTAAVQAVCYRLLLHFLSRQKSLFAEIFCSVFMLLLPVIVQC